MVSLFFKKDKEFKKLGQNNNKKRQPKSLIQKFSTDVKEFSIMEIQMAEKHLKKCSKSLAIRETQIKITLRFHHIPVRMVRISNTSDSSCW